MRRLVLTPEEKWVILVVLIAFLVGLTVKCYRAGHRSNPPVKPKTATAVRR